MESVQASRKQVLTLTEHSVLQVWGACGAGPSEVLTSNSHNPEAENTVLILPDSKKKVKTQKIFKCLLKRPHSGWDPNRISVTTGRTQYGACLHVFAG